MSGASPKGIKVSDIAYVRFSVPDLGKMEDFLADFGMVTAARTADALYSRGSDAQPYLHVVSEGEPGFKGIGFLVEREEELEALTAFADAGDVEPADGPGDGLKVCFTDPSGHRVEAIHWRERPDALPLKPHGGVNSARGEMRKGAPLRLEKGAAQVKRLGHAVLNVIDFRESERWYKERFGFLTSDEIYLGSEEHALGAFMRCDRGGDLTDHHTLFLVGTGKAGFNHAAYEVTDFDDLMVGHFHLKEKGYRHEWGVGRHLLGSQIFDYWRDPWGHTLEHWTDGDRFDASFEAHKHDVDALMGNQWGDPAPPTMGS